MWNEKDHPRDTLGRFTKKEIDDMTADELKQHILSRYTVTGAISGARNPNSDKAKEHAKKYYGLVRSMKTDVFKISNTTGLSIEEIQEIKDFIFCEKHDLGGEELELFEPDFMMGESWRRLMEGCPEPHDLTLIKHEKMEKELIKKGYTQDEAHKITSQKYNYGREATEYYDKIKKYKD